MRPCDELRVGTETPSAARYYGFFASGIARTQEEGKYPIRYSEEYLDASTGVPMITASVPVYDKTGVADGGIPYLFGVIGVDLLTAACVARAGPRITRWTRQGAWAALRVGGRAAAAA